ncbi:MAG: hypothetical protein KAG04_02100 [Mycoplasmataceae bacterium]|nr:hypothetical protein [Mycoplasmataceae bacterium]
MAKKEKKDKKKKNKNGLDERKGAKSAATASMKIPEKQVNTKNIEDISQTTNAMNIILSSASEAKGDKTMEATRDIISKNYDLAVRKIVASFDEILDTGAFITARYLAVQVSLALYEKNLDIKQTHLVIKRFIAATWKKVASGVSVAYTTEIILEPVVYVNKIIPAVTVTPSFAQMVNTVIWDDLFKELARSGEMSLADKDIIESFVNAVSDNVMQGYYIQLGEPIVMKIKLGSSNNMLLFSQKNLKWFNDTYKANKVRKGKGQKKITSNAVNHFANTQEKMSKKEANAKRKLEKAMQEKEAKELASSKAQRESDQAAGIKGESMQADSKEILKTHEKLKKEKGNKKAAPKVAKAPEEKPAKKAKKEKPAKKAKVKK